jgi:hypothetical protein
MVRPIYFHYGHSSVKLLPSGSLREVRRGYGKPTEIRNPINWVSVDDWMQFAQNLTIEYSYDINWTPDQIWLAQWFRHQTLEFVSSLDTLTSIVNRILQLREEFLQNPTNKIRNELQYFETRYKNMYSNASKCRYKIANNQTVPKMLIQEQYGYLHNLYMCLTTGAIAIDSAEYVGTSFAELGIQPCAVFNREFGVYYRVL